MSLGHLRRRYNDICSCYSSSEWVVSGRSFPIHIYYIIYLFIYTTVYDHFAVRLCLQISRCFGSRDRSNLTLNLMTVAAGGQLQYQVLPAPPPKTWGPSSTSKGAGFAEARRQVHAALTRPAAIASHYLLSLA